MLIYLGIPGLLVALAIIQLLLTWRDRRRFRAPGQFVNGLHVHAIGEGRPAVIFESGLGASCLSWSTIQSFLAEHTATCSYDRAGFGWSNSAGAGPCSLEAIVSGLHELVETLRIQRPFVLVAHSFGGYIARLYSQRFPDELAGVVLIDPLTPEEWLHPTRSQSRRLWRGIFASNAAAVLALFGAARFGLFVILSRKKETPGPISRFIETFQRIRIEIRKFPRELVPLICSNWSRPRFFWSLAANLKALPHCAATVMNAPFPHGLPVTVISASTQDPEVLASHRAMATKHLIANQSGHFIQLDEPELIVQEIQAICDFTAGKLAARDSTRYQ